MTWQDIAERLIRDVEQLEREAQYLYDNVVQPNWDAEPHRYWNTLYGLLMIAFASIDLISLYWQGNGGNQTDRMRRFMDKYLSANQEANDVALQMWRHSLMHTAQPRKLLDQRTDTQYRWLLHWSPEQLNTVRHFTFAGGGSDRILNLTLLDLIEQLRAAAKQYAEDLARDSDLQEKCLAANQSVECQAFRSRS